MQIREQGKQVQLIRSSYDKEKKRNIAKVVAHFPRYESDIKLSDDVLKVLSQDEIAEVNLWLSDRKAKADSSAANFVALCANQRIFSVTEVVPQLTGDVAAKVWEEIARLQKALKKAGHKKPAVSAPKIAKDPRQMPIEPK